MGPAISLVFTIAIAYHYFRGNPAVGVREIHTHVWNYKAPVIYLLCHVVIPDLLMKLLCYKL